MLKTKRKKPLRIKTPAGVVEVEYLGRDGSEKQYGLVLPPGCELEKEQKETFDPGMDHHKQAEEVE
jgi:hypothetical protein